ncbi:MFS transporter [Virgibacillus phasianinus]|uniref:MFS transporter n=1 Tax=Virgibacillus phasianinus TaxID=2017483 RepID=A0A220U2M6_9BACI|nr:MFS transporter [Virgibacillus phasianinus]ASK62379.1 MFS transporter [Virgibacillus phasianinus]
MDEKSIRKDFHFLCIGVFFIVLIMATGLPAYPDILAFYDLKSGYAVWIQLGFALGLTGFQPLFGWLGDVYSQKAVVLLGSALMAIGSIVTAVSPYFWLLVIGMFAKGVAGAAVVPAGFTYVGKFFKEHQRGKALSTFGIYCTIGAAIGPFLSGVLVDTLGWQANFWFCAGLSAISLLIFALGVSYVEGDKARSFDFSGVAFMFLVVAGLLTIPTFINNYGLSSWMWFPSVFIFAISFLLLIATEKRQKQPMFDVEYTANRSFWAPAVIAVFLFVTYSGVMYLMTFFVQDVQGKSSTTVGLLQMIIFLATTVGTFFSGRLIARMSARGLLGFGIFLVIFGIAMLTQAEINTTFLYLSISLSLIGIGVGIAGPGKRATVLSKANQSRIGVITFTFNTIENIVQRVGASFALIIFALFAASGNSLSALSNTAVFLTFYTALGLLFLIFIPKTVAGFKKEQPTTNQKKDTLSEVK